MAKPPPRRLGRGLASLIRRSTPDDAPGADSPETVPLPTTTPHQAPAQRAAADGTAIEIRVDRIASNPFQPRRDFDDQELAELAASIQQQGILQPLVVAPSEDPKAENAYVVIAGERRLRAARRAALESVPCIVRHPSRQQMIEWALVENLQRSDLNPLERANAYREYIDRFQLTQAQAAERLGEPRATIANYLRLLDLANEVQALIGDGRLSFGHAKVLGGLIGRPEPQVALARKAARGNLSVRKLEQLVAAALEAGEAATSGRGRAAAKSAYVRDLEAQLTRAVGTRVVIRPSRRKNRGRIVIDYYSLEDFDRIAGALGLDLDS